jgi:hypothetical protein
MEDLLPILIGIIWVAYTLYNKGKKKKVIQQPIKQEKRESKPLSIFEQILMGEEIKIPQPYSDYIEPVETKPIEPIEEHVEKKRKSPSPFLSEELAQFMQEGQSVSKEKMIGEILHEQELEPVEMDFDIRKAVIYSEILNPPYIGYK